MIDGMFPDVLVRLHPLQREEVLVVVRQTTYYLKVRLRNQDLVLARKAHHPLSGVHSVADRVGGAIDVSDQLHRAEIDADADLKWRMLVPLIQKQRVPQLERREHGHLRSTEKAGGGTVAGVENDALVLWHVLDRIGQVTVKPVLPLDLQFHRLRGVIDDIQEQHTAQPRAVHLVNVGHAISRKRIIHRGALNIHQFAARSDQARRRRA